jgi:hypothetical protein
MIISVKNNLFKLEVIFVMFHRDVVVGGLPVPERQ